jgi:nucleoside 2-deoxyribosyltransferase
MRCFVAMPFKGYDELFSKALRPAVEYCFGAGSCSRGDTRPTAQVVGDRIAEEIIWSDVVIAVITGNNPNVMYEVGIAHSLRKPTLLLRDKSDDVPAPFDLAPNDIISYEFTTQAGARNYQELRKTLLRYLTEIRDKPQYQASNVVTRLLGTKYHPFVDDFRGRSGWLCGYLDVLRMESAARTVWEINPATHWVDEDPLFFDRIITSIRERSTKYYYLIRREERIVRNTEAALHEIESRIGEHDRSLVQSCMKYVALEREFFDLMPFSVVIYNAKVGPREAILLEPMAGQIGGDHFDANAAGATDTSDGREPHRWEERTFDVRIGDREIVDLLSVTFQKRWNEAIDEECRNLGDPDAGLTLREHWYIP